MKEGKRNKTGKSRLKKGFKVLFLEIISDKLKTKELSIPALKKSISFLLFPSIFNFKYNFC